MRKYLKIEDVFIENVLKKLRIKKNIEYRICIRADENITAMSFCDHQRFHHNLLLNISYLCYICYIICIFYVFITYIFINCIYILF